MDFYIMKKRPHSGPYTIERLDEMLQEEAINGEDLYWHEGMNSWQPLSSFPGYIPPPGGPPPPPEYMLRQIPSPAMEALRAITTPREKPAATLPEKPATTPPEKPAAASPEKPAAPPPEKPAAPSPEKAAMPPPPDPATIPSLKPIAAPPEKPIRQAPPPPSSEAQRFNLADAQTARISLDEKRALRKVEPPGAKGALLGVGAQSPFVESRAKGATTRAAQKETPPLSSKVQLSATKAVLYTLLFVAVILGTVAGGYVWTHRSAGQRTAAAQNRPRKITTMGDALRFVYGTWTYTGAEAQGAPGQTILWEKLVIKPDGTIDTYSALNTDQSWGAPTTERYHIVNGKYVNSGEKVFAVQVADYDMKIILTDRGTLRETSADREVEFMRGDRFPFSK